MSIDIARLTKKVDVDDGVDLRYYYRIADNLIRKADTYRAERKLIDLYVTLVRFVSLITETIPYHKDYRLSLQSERKDFKRKLLSVRTELVALKPDVERRLAEIHRNTSIPADRQAQPQQNGSSDPYVLPRVRETAPLVEQHLQANDLSATPLPYQVSISPSPVQHGTVLRSSHVANSAPEQPVVSRAMPAPTFVNNSAPEQSLVQRTIPVPTFLINSAPEQPLVSRTMPVPTSSTDSAPEQPLVNRILPAPTYLTISTIEQPLVNRIMPVPTSSTDSAPEQPLVNRILPVPTSSTNSAPEQPLVNRIIPVPTSSTDSAPEQPPVSRTIPVSTFLTNLASQQPWLHRTMPVPTSSTGSAPEQPPVSRTIPVSTFLTNLASQQPWLHRTMPVPTSSTDSAPEQPPVSRTIPVSTFLTDFASQQPWLHRTMPVPTSSTDSAPEQPPVSRTIPVSTFLTNSAPEQPLVNRTMRVSTFLTDLAPEPPRVHRTMPVPTFLRHSVSSSAAHIIAPRSTGITSSRTPEPDMTTDLEHDELTRAIKASIETAIAEGVQIEPSLVQEISRTGTTISLHDPMALYTTLDQETNDDASPKQATIPTFVTGASISTFEGGEEGQNGLCIVCLDSQVEAACIPCGHMAGCLACFKKIEAKSKKCPVCRATVDQVVKIYTV